MKTHPRLLILCLLFTATVASSQQAPPLTPPVVAGLSHNLRVAVKNTGFGANFGRHWQLWRESVVNEPARWRAAQQTVMRTCRVRRRSLSDSLHLLLGALSLFAPAAGAASTNSPFSFRAWQSDDGLPNNTVNAVTQTRDNYLWIATPGRLARFDGVRFESFTLTGLGTHPQPVVNTLLADHEGALWLGLDHGSLLRLRSGEARCFTNGLPDLFAQTLDFGKIPVLNVKEATVPLLNVGRGTPNVKSASLKDGTQGFTLKSFPMTVESGQTNNIKLSFEPAAEMAYTDVLQLVGVIDGGAEGGGTAKNVASAETNSLPTASAARTL